MGSETTTTTGRKLTRAEVASLLEESLGVDVATNLVTTTCTKLGFTGDLDKTQTLALLDELSPAPGLVGIVARFAKARAMLMLKDQRLRLSTLSVTQLRELRTKIDAVVLQATSLEQAAQKIVDRVFSDLDESITLCRLYATFDFASLPPARRKLLSEQETTRIVTLLGTRGRDATHNRWSSAGAHAAIPIRGATIPENAPLASIFHDLGVDADGGAHAKSDGDSIIERPATSYIEDARTAMDPRGRFIVPPDIAAQGSIRTVFATKATVRRAALRTGVVLIVFASEAVDRARAERFSAIVTDMQKIIRDRPTALPAFEPTSA